MKNIILTFFLIALTACQPTAKVSEGSAVSGNTAPAVSTGNAISIFLPQNYVVVEAEAFDADEDQLSYEWKLISGNKEALLETPNELSTMVRNLKAGEYIFSFTATDSQGNKRSAETSVTVSRSNNSPPVANVGADKVLVEPTNTVTITGRGTDPEGDSLSYLWEKVSGDAGAIISNPTSNATSFKNLAIGVYVFRLTVHDGKGASAADEVKVTVSAKSNITPVANAGRDLAITLPLNSISISGNAADGNGDALTYLWTQTSGPANSTMGDANTLIVKISNLIPGNYSFRFKVTDTKGASHSDDVIIAVTGIANSTPSVSVAAAPNIVLPESSVTLTAVGKDTDADNLTYSWTKVGSVGNIISPTSATTLINGLTLGRHKFKVTVSDGKSNASSEASVTVIAAIPNYAPTANAGADASIAIPVTQVSLAGATADQNDTNLTIMWTKVSGGAATVVSPNTEKTDIKDLVVGTYVFKLTVTDPKGLSASDEVTVVVIDQGSVPVFPGKIAVWKRDNWSVSNLTNYDAAIYLPPDYDPANLKKYPLILSLYGTEGSVLEPNHSKYGGKQEGFLRHVPANYGAIVIAPEGRKYNANNIYQSGNIWWNVEYNKRLIDDAVKFYKVDPEKVVITGLSSGGAGVIDLMDKYPTFFAGAMPLAMGPLDKYSKDLYQVDQDRKIFSGLPKNATDITDPLEKSKDFLAGPKPIRPPIVPIPEYECKFTTLAMWVHGNRCDDTFKFSKWVGAEDAFHSKLVQCTGYKGFFKITHSHVEQGHQGFHHGGWNEFWSQVDVKNWLLTRKRGENPPYE